MAQIETDLDLQIILEKGDKAPFKGVLVPEYQYDAMMTDIVAFDKLTDDFIQCSSAMEKSAKRESNSGFFSFGIVTVIIIGLAGFSLGRAL